MTQIDPPEIDVALARGLAQGAPTWWLAEMLVAATEQYHPPVDLSRVLQLWPGLRVTVEDLDGEGYLVDLGGRSGEIFVKQTSARSRRRFTLAHELGHWVLSLSDEMATRLTRAQLEQWCDEFARELLIPRDWLRVSLKVPLPRLGRRLLSLPSLYQVSNQPMWIQCSHHGFLSLVVAGQRVEEYPAGWARPAVRASLVQSTVRFRDQREGGPLDVVMGNTHGIVFRASAVTSVGVLVPSEQGDE